MVKLAAMRANLAQAVLKLRARMVGKLAEAVVKLLPTLDLVGYRAIVAEAAVMMEQRKGVAMLQLPALLPVAVLHPMVCWAMDQMQDGCLAATPLPPPLVGAGHLLMPCTSQQFTIRHYHITIQLALIQ